VARPHYAKIEGGAYRLQINGVETKDELHAGLAREKAAKDAAVAQIHRLQKQAEESAQRQAEQERQDAQAKAEREAELSAEFERENTRKLDEFTASQEALIDGMRADRDRVTEDHAALDIAVELARPGCTALLVPHVRALLQGRRDENGKFSDATRADVTAQLRGDIAFSPITRGASPQDRALHAQHVAQTLGTPPPRPRLARARFEALSPEQRAEHARATEIFDVEPTKE
jgi:hypothetical protein